VITINGYMMWTGQGFEIGNGVFRDPMLCLNNEVEIIESAPDNNVGTNGEIEELDWLEGYFSEKQIEKN
jgi:hypothetical protein